LGSPEKEGAPGNFNGGGFSCVGNFGIRKKETGKDGDHEPGLTLKNLGKDAANKEKTHIRKKVKEIL